MDSVDCSVSKTAIYRPTQHRLDWESRRFFSKVISGPRGRVFKSHHSDQNSARKPCKHAVSGRFLFLWDWVIFAADPYRDPYGIWAGGFWPLGLSPFYAATILFRSALYMGGGTAPTLAHKGPTLAFWRLGRGYSPPLLFMLFLRPQGFSLSEKK